MIGFESPFPPAVSQVGAREWELLADMVYHGAHQVFVVPAGQRTDYASVPQILRWLVDPVTGTSAAILHDYLWREVAPAGAITYREADGILRQALGTLGVSVPRRWLMWAAVRWGSMLTRRGGLSGAWRDLPAVLGVTALALPLVAPTAALLPSLAVFGLVELPWRIGGRERVEAP